MKVTLIPSALPGSAAEQVQYLSTYLIDDTVAIDAGCIGFYRTPREQARVKHVLISHSHIDHLASLPIFLENVYQPGPECVTIYGNTAVLDCLRRDLFNDRLWPDFVALSSAERTFLKLHTLEPGNPVELGGLRITPVAVHHSVPTLGFLVEDATSAIVITSDTGPTEEIWRRANELANLQAVFLEATFPDSMAQLAALSGHLTPCGFAAEIRKLHRPVRAIAMHLKPPYRERVTAELQALGLPSLELGKPGKTYRFGKVRKLKVES